MYFLFKEDTPEVESARSKMWALNIPGYKSFDRENKKKLKKEFAEMYGFKTPGAVPNSFVVFDDCTAQKSPKALSLSEKVKALPRKGNDNMYVEQNMTVKEKTTEDVRREHFLDELSIIYSKKVSELREKFGLDIPKSPKTPKELVEWIKAGEYSFIKGYDPEADDDEDNWCRYEPPYHGIRWTKVKEDRKGYDEAFKALHVELKKFQNEIWAELEPANFIKILDKFEKIKLH